MPLASFHNVSIYYGVHRILHDVSWAIHTGHHVGLIGANGAGKTTILKLLTGELSPDEGDLPRQTGIAIGYLTQDPQFTPGNTVLEEAIEGLDRIHTLEAQLRKTEQDMEAAQSDSEEAGRLLIRYGRLQEEYEQAGGYAYHHRAEAVLHGLGFSDADLSLSVKVLSGGQKTRLSLAKLLLSDADLLLLDEPESHLDMAATEWLEHYINNYAGAVLLVSHDRYFLDNVAGWILELDRGHGIPWEGNYSSWLQQKEARLKGEESQQAAHRKTIEAELEWVRSNPKGRQAKSRARLQRFDELQSKEFQRRNETNEIYIPPGPRLGDLVIEGNGLRKGFGDRLLMDGLSFNLPPGGIVGIIGANGAGKTTLFRMLVGQEQPDDGEIRIGESVQFAYIDQSRDSLDNAKTVWEEISDGQDLLRVGDYETQSRAYVGHFNFRGGDQQKRIGELSGGERNRVHLSKVLRNGGNLLLLDEPTNDLDIETLRALEEALLNFPGCVVVISHDRWLLDRIATHILAFEGASHVEWFEGNYDDYEADRRRRLGAVADQPHRIKYKPLKRS